MAAKYQSSKETINFVRICRLVVDVIPDLFREVLITRMPTSGLTMVLTNHKGLIFPKLNPQQKKTLYPNQGGVFPGSVNDFDLSLLYILLRNIGKIPPHQNGWGRVPDITDRSLSANIDRLRVQRNEAYAHAHTASLSDGDFQTRWSIIRQSVEEIQSCALNGGSFVMEVDSILTMRIDPSTEKNYISLLTEIKGDISDVKDRQDAMVTDMENITGNVSAVRDDVDAVMVDVGAVRDDFDAVVDDVSDVRDDVDAVMVDVGAVRDDFDAVVDDVSAVRDDVDAVMVDVSAVRDDVDAVMVDVGAVRHDVDAVMVDVGAVRDDVGAVKEQLNVISANKDKNPKLTAMIETTKAMILKEKENYTYIQTKSLHEAHEKLMKNRIVIVKGNTGDGKTSIALQLLDLLCNEQEEGQEKRCRQPLELHDIRDFDLVEPNSQLVMFCDDIFGKNVVCKGDVEEWEKRERSVLPKLYGNDHTKANFLIMTIRSTIFNRVNLNILTKQNIVDLNKSLDAKEKLELLRLYKPKNQFDSWTDDEEKEIIKCAPDIGFPQCCRLFKDTLTLQTERVNFFRRPFRFMKSSLSKLKDGKCYALMYLFLNGGTVMKDDLDPCSKNIDYKLLEAAFAVDVVKVTPTDELFYNKGRKPEFVQESLECLLGWLVKKENVQQQGCGRHYCYKFNHDSIEETVALLYGEKTPIGYIQNCPCTFLNYITTSKHTPNRIVISSNDQRNAMYTRLVDQFERVYYGHLRSNWRYLYMCITSLDVWKDTQFLQGFIRWLSDKQVDENVSHKIHLSLLDVCCFRGSLLLEGEIPNVNTPFCVIEGECVNVLKNIVEYLSDEIKLVLFNKACSSGEEEFALHLLSEGVKPNNVSPYCVVKGGSVNLLHKLLEYDVTLTARAAQSFSPHYVLNINVLNEACLFEREDMVTMLCDTYPHLVHDAVDKGGNSLHLVAVTGNCGIFHIVERTVLKALCRVEDAQHKCCRLVDGRVVHRSCACAQYMFQLVDVREMTVLHWSCKRGRRDLCLYLCEAYPGLTTAVDESGWHCLHHIAEWTSDVVMFTECETRVKQYVESTGRNYDITAIRTNRGCSILDESTYLGTVNNPLYNHLVRWFNK